MRGAARLIAAALLTLGAGAAIACEAVTGGHGQSGRSTEAEFTNSAPGGGRHENWVPRGTRLVMHAGFEAFSREYGHDVFGGLAHGKSLTIHVRVPGEARITCPAGVVLPDGQVFEDIAPRLVDLTGDGLPEVVTVVSSVTRGAALAVYDRRGRLVAMTPPIGQANRWLAPAGFGDLDGDGRIEIAYVDRPHLAKVLRIWRLEGGRLREVAAAEGFTNHRIGDRVIHGGVRDCGQGAEVLTADGAWSRLLATRLRDGRIVARDLGAYSARAMDRALDCR
ncbi:VCBS repeat-containing protein [Oceanicola sp. 22II-s10i]|uniref:FG-GAP repeat domain-containing protein n=1 Tax=Oceanicola sp. 22II-s10i TaxID=1317116 RepID=UPI000B526305|nr:VCBS repeat-containing protein [Oceanicola sp. 22II-s10i]